MLPITRPSKALKLSGAATPRALVLLGIHVLVAIHLTHWFLTGSTLSPLEPSEGMAFGREGVINAGFVFFASMILLTAIFGRFFCGWACHLVALQDLSRWWLSRIGIRPRPFRSRFLRFVPLAAFSYMFLWPAVYRWANGDPAPPIQLHLETTTFWATFPGWLVGGLTFLVCGFVTVYFLGAKGFCTYACPYGAAFSLADRLSPGRIRVTDACEGCGHCTATCTSNVLVHQEVAEFGMVVDSGCMKCMDCVSVCPKEALYFGWGKPSLFAGLAQNTGLGSGQFGPGRSAPRWSLTFAEELGVLLAFVAALLTFRGLYGLFPFLLSLGWGAVVAYLSLLAFRLLTKASVRVRRWQLKAAGKLSATGWMFAAIFSLFCILWGHSAAVQYNAWQGSIGFDETADARGQLLRSPATRKVSESTLQTVGRTIEQLRFVDRHSLRGDPKSTEYLAWLSLLAGDTEGFSSASKRALELAPHDVGLREQIADQWMREEQPEAAAPLYEQALQLDGNRPRVALQLGLIEAGNQNFDRAAGFFAGGLAAQPENTDLLYNLALARIAQQRQEEAVALLERAVELAPRFVPARENLAGLLCSLGRFEQGIQQYRQALKVSPDDPGTYLLMARAHLALGKLAAARAAGLAADALAPGHPQIEGFLEELEGRL